MSVPSPSKATPEKESWGAWISSVKVVPGLKYYFSGWCKTKGCTKGGLLLWLWFGSRPKSFGGASGDTNWQLGEAVIEIPPGYSSVPLGLEFRRATGQGWCDDLLAVPYFIKAAYDIQQALKKMQAASVPSNLKPWCDQLSQQVRDLARQFVGWEAKSVHQLYELQRRSFLLRKRLQRIEDRIPLERLDKPITLVAADSLSAIYKQPRYLPNLTAFAKDIYLSAAQGETEPFQIAVIARNQDFSGLSFEIEQMEGPNGEVLPASSIRQFKVDYVQCQTSEHSHDDLWPDQLIPVKTFAVEARTVQPIWFEVTVPREQPAGTYSGKVILKRTGKVLGAVPLTVRVWNFALPQPSHMKAIMSYRPGRLWWTGERSHRDVLLERVAFLADHHIRPLVSSGSLDDTLAIFAMLRKRYGFRWIGMEGLEEAGKQIIYDEAVKEGWADTLFYNVWDEPLGAEAVPRYREFGEKYPRMKRLLTLSGHRTAIQPYEGVVDIWCPDSTNYSRDPKFHHSRRYRWWYMCGSGWVCSPERWRRATGLTSWHMDTEGFLYWATNPCGNYTYENGKWHIKHNGDGGVLYPTPDGRTQASIRIKHVRDGVDDYDYLWTLQELARDCSDTKLKTRAAQLTRLEEVSGDWRSYLRRLRQQIGECIEAIKHWKSD